MDDKLLDIKIAGEDPLIPVLKKRPKSILEEYKWELERKEIVEKKIRDLKCELTDTPEEKLIFLRGELIKQRDQVLGFIDSLKSQKASLTYTWFDKILGNKEKKAAVEELDGKIEKLYKEQWLINDEAWQITRQLELRLKYAGYQVEYNRYMADFEALEKRIGEDAEVVARELRVRNKLAATIDEKRKIGKSIKARIPKNSHCPYCGNVLEYNGVDVHLDHIYPIAKGGESVPENLVYVCRECNQKKSDMTLRSFIRKYGLNRESVELNLDKLGKDF